MNIYYKVYTINLTHNIYKFKPKIVGSCKSIIKLRTGVGSVWRSVLFLTHMNVHR